MEQAIKEKLLAQPVLHVDETGIRICKKLKWLHVASTGDYTFYFPHKKRGKEAIEAIAMLPGYQGVAIHCPKTRLFNVVFDCQRFRQ